MIIIEFLLCARGFMKWGFLQHKKQHIGNLAFEELAFWYGGDDQVSRQLQ